eukprot:scaffold283217_cov17-Prasinocladus_malaysianus.AAC.1
MVQHTYVLALRGPSSTSLAYSSEGVTCGLVFHHIFDTYIEANVEASTQAAWPYKATILIIEQHSATALMAGAI